MQIVHIEFPVHHHNHRRQFQFFSARASSRKMGKDEFFDASEEAKQCQNFSMNTEANRLASFQDWPFDEDCNCVPSKMAAAGFYHCPTEQEPDLVRCFMCSKELDGWEPSDDPLEEHKSHAPKCAFVTKKKDENTMTMAEFFKLESVRQCNRIMTHVENRIKEFMYEAEKTRRGLEDLKDQ